MSLKVVPKDVKQRARARAFRQSEQNGYKGNKGAFHTTDALPLSHRDSTLSEVYYEVHMIRVLHTARISKVSSDHLSLFLYAAQNLPSLLFYLQT